MLSIRQAHAHDWRDYRMLRTAGLLEFPEFFPPSDEELLAEDSYWQQKIVTSGRWIFLLFDGDAPVGLTGMRERAEDGPCDIYLIASYLLPNYRGQGNSRYFYEARLGHAKNVLGKTRALINHRDTNAASAAAIRKHGFAEIGRRDNIPFGDGTTGTLVDYELKL